MKKIMKATAPSILLVLALIGCTVNASNDISKEDKLSLNNVENAFTTNGLKFTEQLSPKAADITKFNGVSPAAAFETNGHKVLIYIYDSQEAAQKAVEEYMAPLKGVTFNGPWTKAESAKNLMFLFDIQATNEYAIIQKLKS